MLSYGEINKLYLPPVVMSQKKTGVGRDKAKAKRNIHPPNTINYLSIIWKERKMFKIFKVLAVLTMLVAGAVFLYDRYLGSCECGDDKCC